MRIHLVPHTHWDREWYKTAEAFRVHLVPLVDRVLAGELPFLLDGQGIVVEDYLAWVPGHREVLARALQSGRVEAGPWYVLADNLIPGGEALVRNLLLGRTALGALGATPPPVLYCPDTFGHPSLAPILAAGFGLSLAIVWRGYGGRGWPPGDTARWRAADGSEVLLHHLPPSGYEFGASLPDTPAAAGARVAEWLSVLGARSASGELLVLNGADHHAPPSSQARQVALVRDAAGTTATTLGGLRGFAAAQRAWAAARKVPVVTGELRASPGYTWALPGTLAARAAQKRANAQLERILVSTLEPLLALARWEGGDDHAAARRATWRLLLENHPHDTLCGCSSDAVALAMDQRARQVQHAATELMATVVQQLVAPGRAAHDPGVPSVALVNSVPRVRRGVVDLVIDVPVARVGVGPGSSPAVPEAPGPTAVSIGDLPLQVLRRETTFARDEHRERYPRNMMATRLHALAWVGALPGQGFQVAPLGPRASRRQPPQASWVAPGRELNNGHLAVWYDESQGLCCAANGTTLTDLLRLECEGECGDLYTHAAIAGSRETGRVIRQRVTLRGPLRSELQLTVRVPVAARELASATGARIRRRAGRLDVTVRVQLDAGARCFRLWLEGDNRHEDIRLRAVVRTACAAATHLADAGFGPVVRRSAPPAAQPGDVETVPESAPLHRHVSCFDPWRGYGVTVVSDGLAEYAVVPHGDVSVTLLRAVGELSRANLVARPGHAGWPQATPGAQSQGPFSARLAVSVHGLDTPATRGAIEALVSDELVPLRGYLVRDASVLASAGLEVEGHGVRLLACKPADDGEGIVVRMANVTAVAQAVSCALPGLARGWLARLDESPMAALATSNHRVQLHLQPHAVVTLRLARAPIAGPRSP